MPGSYTSELRQPGTNAHARRDQVRPKGSLKAWLRHCSRPCRFDWPPARPRRSRSVKLEVSDHPTRPPSCRTDSELRPLLAARPRHFDWSAWGTHEFLGRGAKGPQRPGRGKRPGSFDPEELFGAALGLTHHRESRGAADEGECLRSTCNDLEAFLLLPRSYFVS